MWYPGQPVTQTRREHLVVVGDGQGVQAAAAGLAPQVPRRDGPVAQKAVHVKVDRQHETTVLPGRRIRGHAIGQRAGEKAGGEKAQRQRARQTHAGDQGVHGQKFR
jgi:hypothetical protein